MKQIIPAEPVLQLHRIPLRRQEAPGGKRRWYRIRFEGGRGGQAATDIDKGRCSAVIPAWAILASVYNDYDFNVSDLRIGEDDATIASTADIVITIPSGEGAEFVKLQEEQMNQWLREEYPGDSDLRCTIVKCERRQTIVNPEAVETLLTILEQIPQGVVAMGEAGQGVVSAFNNVGRIMAQSDHFLVSTFTHAGSEDEQEALCGEIAGVFREYGAVSERVGVNSDSRNV